MPNARIRQNSPLANRTILIVEDDPLSLLAISRVVKKVNGQGTICHAATMEAARAFLEGSKISLVIADHFLAGIGTGMDLWRFCRDQCPHVQFLLTSGLNAEKVRDLSLEDEGHPFFLAKPIRAEECQKVIHCLLAKPL